MKLSSDNMFLKRSRIALAQCSAVLGSVEKNAKNHLELSIKAKNEGADAIIFPELSLTGYTLRDLNNEVALDPRNSPLLNDLRELSKEITIICGGVERSKTGGVHNAAFVFEGGKCIHSHHKIYPPTYGIFEEERYFLAGNTARVIESQKLGRIGVLICEDLWHPSLPYMLAYQGAQMIVTIAASPTKLGIGADNSSEVPQNYKINSEHHVAYARLFSLYLAFVNRVGVEDGVNFWGGSEIVSPNGDILQRASFFDNDLIYVDIDPNAVLHAREYSRHMLDENLLLTQQLLGETIVQARN
ncbi:MAG: nitrilase-related carbon-nitrogen hydrolase [Bacteroidota bacterium]|nr:nitrilase-related carbon-nitrogen hydrolase [Bacteroidota bacterium]MDP4230846.1 nitrilase-related carbon-nitrogen hydrolase [Bacteroidota bacterium]MDP4235658.1 nitrilase-related carbon-nitrogen hydrolase [Bacteroidota bacterium]